jgi:hypothetical protein
MKKFREIIYKNTNFTDFLIIYINRFPNSIIPEIIDIKVKKEEKDDNKEYIKRSIKIYDDSPRLLRKLGINLSEGKIIEKVNINYNDKIIESIANNKTLSNIIKVTEKDLIKQNGNDIIWESFYNIRTLIPGISSIINNRLIEFKNLEKEIIDTYLYKKIEK